VADEQVIKILEEIRDLHKEHLESYREAVKNQQESIEINRRALRRQKITSFVFGGILLVFLIFLAWASLPHAG
jgi:cell division septal protein FtsQ